MSDVRESAAAVLLLAAPTWLFGWLLREAIRLWQLHIAIGDVPSDAASCDPTFTTSNPQHTTDHFDPQPATLNSQPIPISAILTVAGWLTLEFLSHFLVDRTHPPALSSGGIQFACLLNLLIWGALAYLLTAGGRRPWRDAGMYFRGFPWQIALGGLGFLAAIWPTMILMILCSGWRNEETQHLYLQALRGPSGGQMLAWVFISAVLFAPLTEELLFRVTLQGWLSERLPGPAAIGLTALIFALVHGWRDALPLIPLSLILGYIFHQTRSYWACVTTHAVFNAANITLAIMAMGEG